MSHLTIYLTIPRPRSIVFHPHIQPHQLYNSRYFPLFFLISFVKSPRSIRYWPNYFRYINKPISKFQHSTSSVASVQYQNQSKCTLRSTLLCLPLPALLWLVLWSMRVLMPPLTTLCKAPLPTPPHRPLHTLHPRRQRIGMIATSGSRQLRLPLPRQLPRQPTPLLRQAQLSIASMLRTQVRVVARLPRRQLQQRTALPLPQPARPLPRLIASTPSTLVKVDVDPPQHPRQPHPAPPSTASMPRTQVNPVVVMPQPRARPPPTRPLRRLPHQRRQSRSPRLPRPLPLLPRLLLQSTPRRLPLPLSRSPTPSR